jgi:hypothetical protein
MRTSRRPILIVTGSDWSHAPSLLQFLASVGAHEPETEVVVYDLGLTPEQRSDVERAIHNGHMEVFRFEDFPAHFDISRNAGEYAWKPTIVAAELAGRRMPVVWMDAGNVLVKPIHHVRRVLARTGFYSEASSGTVPDWTHPGMLRWFGLPPEWGVGRRNLNGSCVGFDPAHPLARQVAEEWARCARIRECIAPEGSSRANHRQDQALLTVLAYRSGLVRRPVRRSLLRGREILTHRDVPPAGSPPA